MPLALGLPALQAELLALYLDTGAEKSVDVFAKKKAQAINDFVLTAIPMTQIIFAGPAVGTGIGGLDKPAPGMGLDAAKVILEQQFIAIWTHGGGVKPPAVQAQLTALAIFTYFSQAMVMTDDLGPLDPITMSGASTGKGGVVSSSPGKGYASAKPALEAELKRIWSQVKAERSVAQFSKEMAQAIHDFCKEGKVTTVGVIAGGVGLSVSSSIS